ncbi:hypothetical protein TEA_000869 [Camellia sinensis var. sinensis]|uniref:leucine--tRNA ligase n=1 Tax=Camellia sinensis var. sinensis TaxID=542762 RepID=A0A4S4F3N2_CAMSN|nr:hypothetical protein TEA_000869 [Camellia sinensis var. sinensis]
MAKLLSGWSLVVTTDPLSGKPARRETNTMPQWAGSCWEDELNRKENLRVKHGDARRDIGHRDIEGGLLKKTQSSLWHWCSNSNQGIIRGEVQLLGHKVTEEIEGTRFNTGISAMMEFINAAYKWDKLLRSAIESFVLLLSPYAPHIAEELWSRLGHSNSLAYEPFPKADPVYRKESTVVLPIQINGKTRGTIQVEETCTENDAFKLASIDQKLSKYLDCRNVRKKSYVPGKILNVILEPQNIKAGVQQSPYQCGHWLRDCEVANQVWVASHVYSIINRGSQCDFLLWVAEVASCCDDDGLGLRRAGAVSGNDLCVMSSGC